MKEYKYVEGFKWQKKKVKFRWAEFGPKAAQNLGSKEQESERAGGLEESEKQKEIERIERELRVIK